MIESTLRSFAAHLNRGLGIAGGEEAVIAAGTPPREGSGSTVPGAVLTLVGSAREVSVQNTHRSGAVAAVSPAPLRLNLDVLLSVSGGEYIARLSLLERLMRQIHYVDHLNPPLTDTAGDLVRLHAELQNIDIQTASQIWTALQADMRPHALYRLRGVVLQSDAATQTVPSVGGIDIDIEP